MPKSTLFGHFRIRQITLCLHWSGSCQKCHFRSQKVALKRGFFVSSVITIHGNQFSASLGHVFFWALFGPFWTPGGVQMDHLGGGPFYHWTCPMVFQITSLNQMLAILPGFGPRGIDSDSFGKIGVFHVYILQALVVTLSQGKNRPFLASNANSRVNVAQIRVKFFENLPMKIYLGKSKNLSDRNWNNFVKTDCSRENRPNIDSRMTLWDLQIPCIAIRRFYRHLQIKKLGIYDTSIALLQIKSEALKTIVEKNAFTTIPSLTKFLKDV